jgi:DegV family protein with EDD domain
MVAVVTDSASNVPAGLAHDLGITIVPLWVRLGDDEFRDGVDMPPGRFYERLGSAGERASTATPSPADFLDAFERTRVRDVVCVTVAASMSAVFHQALSAAEQFAGTAIVVDSMNASMAEGFVVVEAARAAADGEPADRVADRARQVAGRCSLFATLGTFEFLQRSGRVTRLQAYAGTILDINPVFSFRLGEPAGVARPRTRRRALERVADEAVDAIGDRAARIAAIHADSEADARVLLDAVTAQASVIERHVVEVTPVIGAHTGPGLVGMAVFAE